MPSHVRSLLSAMVIAGAVVLSACSGSGTENPAPNTLQINTGPNQDRVLSSEVAAIAAEVPPGIRAKGSLEIAASSNSDAPLGFYATDNRTFIGAEPDFAYAIASVLGLKVHYNPVAFAQIFVGLDSGKYDVAVSNITVTEFRKEKYDFATYRKDVQAFEAKKTAEWTVRGPKDLAGKTIAVTSGTSQEKLLLDWSAEVAKAGLAPVNIKYYQDESAVYLALQSGQIDAYLHRNPSARYHAEVSGQTHIIGLFSGAGESQQGLIAATTVKNNGLVKALNSAINHLIETGVYNKILARWGLSDEAVTSSQINPPGLPK